LKARLKNAFQKIVAAVSGLNRGTMLMRKANGLRMHARSVFRRIFHLLLHRLGIRCFKEHSFFGTLLPQPAIIVDVGAHRGEFFAALKSEYSISRALLIEANPALAAYLQETFGNETDVLHAALLGGNKKGPIRFTRATNPEASSIFSEWAAAWGVVDQVDVHVVDLSKVIHDLGGQVDLVKLDVEGAEVEVLQTVRPSDLAACSQLTVEFHEKRPPMTQHDFDRVCHRLRSEGYGIVKANWPYVNDVLFVNLKRMPAAKRMGFRCGMALVNALFITRRAILDRLFANRV
jgi:FkbM family methyltransferase